LKENTKIDNQLFNYFYSQLVDDVSLIFNIDNAGLVRSEIDSTGILHLFINEKLQENISGFENSFYFQTQGLHQSITLIKISHTEFILIFKEAIKF
jgi:hypothetical protein